MKKIFSFIVGALVLGFASCEDVPAPYELFAGDGQKEEVTSIYYTSSNLYTGWSLVAEGENQPWSQGSSYTQATGYQAWGGDTKSNKEVTGYLISPKFNTVAQSGKVKMYFDHTLRYTNNVSGWKDNHKIFITKDWDGDTNNFNIQNWTQIDYTPAASTYTDWTLYSSGEIQIPDEFVNVDGVYVCFYFHAPATASTTWELMNFTIEEGEAQASTGGGGDDTGDVKALGYTSASLSDFGLYAVKEQPWSQGSSYTQATGYQKWGSDTKSNKEVEGYLISPAIKTTCTSGKVMINFDNTIRYTNNVSGWEQYHKIYVSDNYDGSDFSKATWTQVNFTPVASTYTDWTLYGSGDIQLPDAYANKEKVYVAFYFYAPATASTTWELTNFKIEEGVAADNGGGNTGGGDDNPGGGETNNGGVTRSVSGVNVTWTVDGVTAGSTTDEVDFSTLGYENGQEVVEVKLDHCTIAFDKGTNKNGPKYYTATNGIRLYACNTMTFNSTQPIAQVVLVCDSYSGTDYVGNAETTFTVDGNTLVMNNYNAAAGVQLRIKTMKIIYADAASRRK